MKTLSLLLLTLSCPAFAAQRGLPPLMTPAQTEGLRELVAKAKQWTSVYAHVESWNAGSFDISEGNLRLNLHGYKTGDRFSFNGWAGNESLYFSVTGDPKWGYSFWGSDMNFNLRPSGSSYYYLSGTMGGRAVNFTLSKFGDGYSIWGQPGVNLNVHKSGSGYYLQGSLDEAQGAAKLVGALGSAIAVISTLK